MLNVCDFNFFAMESETGDVFVGVCPLAMQAAKKVRHVYANDLNPHAIDYIERNYIINKLEREIEVCL